MTSRDTVYALATPVGGAIAVIRISGGGAHEALRGIFTGAIRERYMAHGQIVCGERILDDVMATAFFAPRSYTGEDMVEIYAHGSRQTVADIMELLLKRGLCPAEPGEFTKRAFLNGKLDLSEAEAVMDVINASAKRSAQSALLQLSGALRVKTAEIESILYDALSTIDAAIDYPDEMEADAAKSVPTLIDSALIATGALISRGACAASIREGVRAVIAGRPNAGKSSLLNRLTGAERAIVTANAGTTRDTLSESVSINGVPFILTDTAGLRDASDEAEAIGVRRARDAMDAADLLVLAFDGGEALDDADRALLDETEGRARIAVVTKSDAAQKLDTKLLVPYHIDIISVSSITGEGLIELRELMLKKANVPLGEGELVTNARHVDALRKAAAALECAAVADDAELIATDIRDALRAIGAISGREVDAHVIDEIFSRFCVGK